MYSSFFNIGLRSELVIALHRQYSWDVISKGFVADSDFLRNFFTSGISSIRLICNIPQRKHNFTNFFKFFSCFFPSSKGFGNFVSRERKRRVRSSLSSLRSVSLMLSESEKDVFLTLIPYRLYNNDGRVLINNVLFFDNNAALFMKNMTAYNVRSLAISSIDDWKLPFFVYVYPSTINPSMRNLKIYLSLYKFYSVLSIR